MHVPLRSVWYTYYIKTVYLEIYQWISTWEGHCQNLYNTWKTFEILHRKNESFLHFCLHCKQWLLIHCRSWLEQGFETESGRFENGQISSVWRNPSFRASETITNHGMFLEYWNTTKNISNIWQHVSCLTYLMWGLQK